MASRPCAKPVGSQTACSCCAVSADGAKRLILQSPEPLLISVPKYPKSEKGETFFKAIRFGDRDSMNKAIACMANGKMDRLAELSAAFMARSCKSSQAAGGKRLAA